MNETWPTELRLAKDRKVVTVSFVEGKEGWHGKPFKKGEELDRALAELDKQFVPSPSGVNLAQQIARPTIKTRPALTSKPIAPPKAMS